jgi:hypothetical protein
MPSKGYLFGQKSCHCGCEICPHCSASCLSVTLSGFSGDCAKFNGTHKLTRGAYRGDVSVGMATSTGSGADFAATLGWDDATGTYYIASVEVVEGGEGYDDSDTLTILTYGGTSEIICDKEPVLEVAIESGVVMLVNVVERGQFVYLDPCGYLSCRIELDYDTPNNASTGSFYTHSQKCHTIHIAVTDTLRVISLTRDGAELARGEIAAEGNPCSEMTFGPGDFTGDCSPGTAIVTSEACDSFRGRCCNCEECFDCPFASEEDEYSTFVVVIDGEIAEGANSFWVTREDLTDPGTPTGEWEPFQHVKEVKLADCRVQVISIKEQWIKGSIGSRTPTDFSAWIGMLQKTEDGCIVVLDEGTEERSYDLPGLPPPEVLLTCNPLP